MPVLAFAFPLQGRASECVWLVFHFFGFFYRIWKFYVSSPKAMLSLCGCGSRLSGGGALLWADAQPSHLRPSGFALRPKLFCPHIRNGQKCTTTRIKYCFKFHLKQYFICLLLQYNSNIIVIKFQLKHKKLAFLK